MLVLNSGVPMADISAVKPIREVRVRGLQEAVRRQVAELGETYRSFAFLTTDPPASSQI